MGDFVDALGVGHVEEGVGEGGFDLRDAGAGVEAGFGSVAPGEDIFFGRLDSVQTPVVESQDIGELVFDGTEGVEIFDGG